MPDLTLLQDELADAVRRLASTTEPIAQRYIQNEIKVLRRELKALEIAEMQGVPPHKTKKGA